MVEKVQEIVAFLPDLNDVNGVRDMAEQRLAEGDAAFVADLGIALFRAYGSADRPIWQYRSVFDSVFRLLTVAADAEHLGHALRLLGAVASDDRKMARYAASLLASSRSATDLARAFAGGQVHAGGLEELRACLVHELVVRGEPISDLPGIAPWTTAPHWRYHPLGWLPLHRSSIEQSPGLPSYSAHGSSYPLPFGSSDAEAGPAPAGDGRTTSAVETTTPSAAAEIARAVENWAEESNGRIEARTFALSAAGGSMAEILSVLSLDCLAAKGRRSAPSASTCAPSRVWQVLFAAASTGGAYNHGLYGAYGRLEAWKSMAGLSGAPQTATFADVEHHVHDHRWFTFSATTKWFEQVAWDIAIAALSPDGLSLAVLAATDTD
ncbi:DUF6183 family protein [Nonomuraea sp. NPDC052265]|uniref:DUF6183 family protein n=1 Tax=Nonomuraea sp. NPDC052265 TaxID=3364374 RepID=UPI0037CC4DC9